MKTVKGQDFLIEIIKKPSASGAVY